MFEEAKGWLRGPRIRRLLDHSLEIAILAVIAGGMGMLRFLPEGLGLRMFELVRSNDSGDSGIWWTGKDALTAVAVAIPFFGLTRLVRHQSWFLGGLLAALAAGAWFYWTNKYAPIVREIMADYPSGLNQRPILLSSVFVNTAIPLTPLAAVLGGLWAVRGGFRWWKWIAGSVGLQVATVALLFASVPWYQDRRFVSCLALQQVLVAAMVLLPLQRKWLEDVTGVGLVATPHGDPPAREVLRVLRLAWVLILLAVAGTTAVSNWRLATLVRYAYEGPPPRHHSPAEINGADFVRERFHRIGSPVLDVVGAEATLAGFAKRGKAMGRAELFAQPPLRPDARSPLELERYTVYVPHEEEVFGLHTGATREQSESVWAMVDEAEAVEMFDRLRPYFDDIHKLSDADYLDLRDPETGHVRILSFINVRNACRYLVVRMAWDLHHGRRDKAIAAFEDLVHLGGMMRRDPRSLVEYMMGSAVLGIAMSGAQTIASYVQDDPEGLALLAESIGKTAPDVRSPFDFEEVKRVEMGMSNIVPAADVAVASFKKVQAVHYGRWQRFDSIEIGVAARRYFLDRGEWPGSIDAMFPEYLDRVRRDPFQGGDYKLEFDSGGPIVFCAACGEDSTHVALDPAWEQGASGKGKAR